MTQDEMVGWHHRLNGHEFEQAPGVGDGQGGLACCGPWGCKESDTPKRLNNSNKWNTELTFFELLNFVYFWLPWVFVVVRGLSLVGRVGFSLRGPLSLWALGPASVVAALGLPLEARSKKKISFCIITATA